MTGGMECRRDRRYLSRDDLDQSDQTLEGDFSNELRQEPERVESRLGFARENGIGNVSTNVPWRDNVWNEVQALWAIYEIASVPWALQDITATCLNSVQSRFLLRYGLHTRS